MACAQESTLTAATPTAPVPVSTSSLPVVTTAPPAVTPTLPPVPTPGAFHMKDLLDTLVRRGNDLVANVTSKLTAYRTANNYFVRAIEDELRVLNTVLTDLKEEQGKPESAFNQAFLLQATLQVTRHENILTEMFLLADKANNDPSYRSLLEMVDALLARAYQDYGMLVVHKKEAEGKEIEKQIAEIETLETKLKSLNFKTSPEEVQKVVEEMLQHERIIEEELYRIEHLKTETSTF